MGIILVNKTNKLIHVNLFFYDTIEEHIIHINVTNIPVARNKKKENHTYRKWFDYETESF